MSLADKDSTRAFCLDSYCVSEELGFILLEPLTELPPYYQPWMDIALHLPELVHSHELRSRVSRMPLLSSQYLQTHRELRLAHLALGATTMSYVWQEGEDNTVKVLPRNLALPYWKVSQTLGLPPIFIHADAVLANWKKLDPEGNLDLVVRLPGGESLRGFFMVTLLAELAACPALKSIPTVFRGVSCGHTAAVARALQDIRKSIHNMTEALKLMHVYVEPSIFYGVIRIYLSGWKDNLSMPNGLIYEGVHPEPMEFSGGSAAQSSILHSFDELFGIEHAAEAGAFLTRMRDYMPPAHKQMIQDISNQPSLRNFVQEQCDEELNQEFQLCVTELIAFRNYHINMVSRYITVPAARGRQLRSKKATKEEMISKAPTALEETGTGGSSIMSFLKTVRDETKQVFLPINKN
ncbi:indoleamine 2,3-dioxygenase 1 isoform X2 [Eucyclogobius newberryi]|uniref:indoleamine 2,3-dioxygenase 1 isoform X2 n=1 Tax=Eucyclogobius newberryi TaxID=166745 RepID=UPI003B5CD98F